MPETRRRRIDQNEDTIFINSLDQPACVSDFICCMRKCKNLGYRHINIFANPDKVFPNACVPIAGIISYYQDNGFEFSFDKDILNYLKICNFISPLEIEAKKIKELATPFDRIFRYSESSQVAALTQAYIDSLSRTVECNQGVIEGIIWCINEVMDNVLIHSEASSGFVMSQFHANTNHIAFCVYDTGIGIYNSLSGSRHHPSTTLDAISLSMQEGVGDGKGQGNGLFGLNKIVESNGGRLTITTGSASIMQLISGERRSYQNLPVLDPKHSCTTVDFQLDISKDIDIKGAFDSIGGFDGFDIRLDNMLQDNDFYLYDVFDNCEGTATRIAGLHIRNDVVNTIQRISAPIILDFSKVTSVSSSFIDEFVSKLVMKYGFVSFNQIVRIIGTRSTVKFLLERSTYMRIHDMWQEKDNPIDKLFDGVDESMD